MLTPADNADSADISAAAAKPRRRSRGDIQKDPWEGWAPERETPRTPHHLQERHSPTLPVPAKDSRRRIVDARLWDAMAPAQQQAALEIAMIFEVMSRGLGYAVSDWTRALTGRGSIGNAADIHARLLRGYTDWAARCHKAKVSHSMVIDILVFGFSCSALDRDRRTSTGWSRRNLLKGLALYCEVKGWPV